MHFLIGSGKGGAENFATALCKVVFSWFLGIWRFFENDHKVWCCELGLTRRQPCSSHHLPHQINWMPPGSCPMDRKGVRMAPESLQTYTGRVSCSKYESQTLAYQRVSSAETLAFFELFSKSVPNDPQKSGTFCIFRPFRGRNPSN